jgi:hypothetical protein
MRLSLAKLSILVTYSRSLVWKPIKTGMSTNDHLDLDMGGTSVDQKVYHSMIEPLLYLYEYGPIFCLVCVCVQDSKLHPKIVI